MVVKPINWLAIIAFWLVLAVVLVIRANLLSASVPLYSDTDDAMRMVTVTDLVNGQNWQDQIEHRDNTPYGASMHWSRLVDAPIAGLVLLLRPFAGAAATDWAALVWPVMLLLPLFLLSVALSRRLAGPEGELPGMALPILALPVVVEFLPGRVDHHNVQILLTLALVYCTLAGRTSLGWAMVAGAVAASSIAIGVETIATVVVAVVAFGLFWVVDPRAGRRPLIGFAVAFPLAMLAHFLLASPPALYWTVACDALSFTYVSSAALAGGAMGGAAWLGSRLGRPSHRLALIGGLGALAGAAALALSPACIGGPYAQVPSELANAFFPVVKEAQDVLVRFADDPALTIAFVGAPLAAVVIGVVAACKARGDQRVDWLVLLGYAAAGLIVTAMQIRGARFAGALAVPAGAWLIVSMRERFFAGRNTARLAGLLASWLLFAGVLHFGVGSAIAGALGNVEYNTALRRASYVEFDKGHGDSPRALCFNARNYGALAALPKGRIMTPIDTGALILRYTPHSVTGAGYHRNHDGMLDTFHFFNSDEATARAIAAARGLDYVAVCKAIPEFHELDRAGPTSFTRTYAAGGSWSWLVPLSDPSAVLQIYRIALAP